MRLLIHMITVLVLTSCTSTKVIKAPNAIIDHDLDERIVGTGSIKLLDHQLVPIDYLLKHPEQKGLLVNHYMGTGKTYLGIGFAESMLNHPVIILAPKFIESNWMTSLANYGVKIPSRYQFVSYDDAPEKLSAIDLSKHILLADEVHNLIKYVRSSDPEINARYIDLYTNLRTAYKILGLTGTPIYGDESDIAYMINLVSGKDLMPFNQESFRLAYTDVLTTRQFFRGYMSESMFLPIAGSIVLAPFFGAIFGFWGNVAGGIMAGLIPPIINLSFDLSTYKLRKLDVEKMLPFMNTYVSYFKFDESTFIDFPDQEFTIEEVPYSKFQYSFFLRLVEGDLPATDLQRLLKNSSFRRDDKYIAINSSNIHEQLYSVVGAGRDIGNFEFTDEQGQLIEAPKFTRLYQALQKQDEQTVIYSNYFETGIVAFRDFLIRQGYDKPFAIIKPDLLVDEVTDIVNRYNRGDIKLLLLHPEITEGISLKGTQYLHILEPMLNPTVLEQVIGRTRRFQSHRHLPKNKQKVHVHMWQSTSSIFNPELSSIKRANWYNRYREVSYMSRWGIGVSQVDKKYDRKVLNPEELALLKLKTIEKNFAEMQALLTIESIERGYRQ